MRAALQKHNEAPHNVRIQGREQPRIRVVCNIRSEFEQELIANHRLSYFWDLSSIDIDTCCTYRSQDATTTKNSYAAICYCRKLCGKASTLSFCFVSTSLLWFYLYCTGESTKCERRLSFKKSNLFLRVLNVLFCNICNIQFTIYNFFKFLKHLIVFYYFVYAKNVFTNTIANSHNLFNFRSKQNIKTFVGYNFE